jgi:hypothetical protein
VDELLHHLPADLFLPILALNDYQQPEEAAYQKFHRNIDRKWCPLADCKVGFLFKYFGLRKPV